MTRAVALGLSVVPVVAVGYSFGGALVSWAPIDELVAEARVSE